MPHKPEEIPRGVFHDSHSDRHLGLLALGAEQTSIDFHKESERLYRWKRNGDIQFSKIADWENFLASIDDEFGYLKIPKGTRSATSVLSGLEAWSGEKREIIDYVVHYQQTVAEAFGGIDTTVEFDKVAVTKDRKMFVVPPHHVADALGDQETWLLMASDDLNGILRTEPARIELIDVLRRGIEAIKEV